MDHLNIFFNTKINEIDSKCMADLPVKFGNFCLAGVRYLFDGNVVTIQNDNGSTKVIFAKEFKPKQSSIQRYFLVIAAIVSVFPGIIIGTPFKALGYLSSQIQNRHQITVRNIPSSKPDKPPSLQEETKPPQQESFSLHRRNSFHVDPPSSENVQPEPPKVVTPLVNFTYRKIDPLTAKLNTFTDPNLSGSVGGVYITTNERRVKKVSKILAEIPQNKGCHIGFSGWHNFEIMALRKSELGIICDFNPKNKEFIDYTLGMLRTCASKIDFLDKIIQFEKNHYSFEVNLKFNNLNPKEELKAELTRKESWICNNESFEHIQRLAKEDKIAVITQNVCETEIFKRIKNLVTNNSGLQIDTVYLSNICKYMETEESKISFAATVHAIIQSNSIIINCPKSTSFDSKIPKTPDRLGFPHQQVTLGKDYDSSENDKLLFAMN